ncbi:MAG TPA: protein kinase, partial [Gemmatales bacterium]|nr:protein kinase [Gemmatales bacterium]
MASVDPPSDAPLTSRLPGHPSESGSDGPPPSPTTAGPATWLDADALGSVDRHVPPGPDAVRLTMPSIPGYELLAELGRGGMGVVYLARDERLKRQVAIKMLPGSVLTMPEDQVVRFRAEAEAIAKLTHPGIVQIYDFGTASGQPYFVLEFVEGGTLRDWAKGRPQDPRWAADLLAHLADAMNYAHDQGIIHRDLKPANVLLGRGGARPGSGLVAAPLPDSPPAPRGKPSAPEGKLPPLLPKITDFGLAKFDRLTTEGNSGPTPTRTGEVVGTPNYMAPEQARGVSAIVTPLVDIYALGAILYELLTGRPPYNAPTAMDTLMQLLQEEVVPPRRLQPGVPRDLETICLRCLQRDAPRRYAAAGDLAADLRRFLSGEPVLARPTPIWERAWKWAKRRPAGASLIGVCVLALALLIGGGWYYNTMLAAALESARTAEQASLQSAQLARENAALAERQARLAMDGWSTIVDDLQRAFANIPETRRFRTTLLKRAMAGLDQLAAANLERPRDYARAMAHCRLADNYKSIGQRDLALREAESALAIAQEMLQSSPQDEELLDMMCHLHHWFGERALDRDQPREAEQHFKEALQYGERLLVQAPGRSASHYRVGNALEKLAHSQHWQNRREEALATFARASAFAKKFVAEHPEAVDALDLYAVILNWEGVLAEEAQDLEQARLRFEEARTINLQRLERSPHRLAYRRFEIVVVHNLAMVAEKQGNLSEALRHMNHLPTAFGDLVESDPDNIVFRCEHADAYFHLANLLLNASDFVAAAAHAERALTMLQNLKDAGKLQGFDLYGVQRIDEARRLLERSADAALAARDPNAAARLPLPRAAPALGQAFLLSSYEG